MQIDMEVADLILRIVQWGVVPFALWIVRSIWLLRRELAVLRGKQCGLEEKVDALPKESALHKLAMLIESQSGDIKSMNAVLIRVENLVTRHDDFLRGDK